MICSIYTFYILHVTPATKNYILKTYEMILKCYDYVLTIIIRASLCHHINYELCNCNRKDLTAFS